MGGRDKGRGGSGGVGISRSDYGDGDTEYSGLSRRLN